MKRYVKTKEVDEIGAACNARRQEGRRRRLANQVNTRELRSAIEQLRVTERNLQPLRVSEWVSKNAEAEEVKQADANCSRLVVDDACMNGGERRRKDTTVEVDLNSLEAKIGYGSLLRELQHAYIERVAYYRSAIGGSLELGEARAKAYHACKDFEEAKQIYDKMMSYPLDCLDFVDLAEMWPVAPRMAEGIWEKLKIEAGDRFESGHLATEAVCPEHYMRTAWSVASYLGLRESFIAEWGPTEVESN